ncbi:Beta N-acetyl-glucosaminidase [Oxalobacteraceae bacterium IMCC9480]|nr:Beta N-acetyl-glucosaminidase [Oxalobacteraceae bacterium IMCC9480]
MGFEGVIFSDDLSMEGASIAGDVVAGATAALQAGCDMVLICNRPDMADQLLGGLDPSLMSPASAARVAALLPAGAAMSWDALQTDQRYLSALRTIASLMHA